jgi:hypothetical protein
MTRWLTRQALGGATIRVELQSVSIGTLGSSAHSSREPS